MKYVKISLLAIFLLAGTTLSAQDKVEKPAADAVVPAESLPKPMDFAKAGYKQALALNKMKVGSARDKAIIEFVDALVDYERTAVAVLGKHYKTATDAQKSDFVAVFKDLMRKKYLEMISDKSFNETVKVTWEGAKTAKDKKSATVDAFYLKKDVETEITLKLFASDNTWKVDDVHLDGASLIRTYAKKYDKVISEKGLAGLLAEMKAEIAK